LMLSSVSSCWPYRPLFRSRFVFGVPAGLAHEECGETEAECGVGDAEVEGLGAQAVVRGEEPGGECGERDGAVAGGFVEAHGEAADRKSTRLNSSHVKISYA